MFITFEGIDGSGKSTQIDLLTERIRNEGVPVETFRDPGGPEVSEKVREILLDPDYEVDPVTELLLFSAARSQLVAESIVPNLQKGSVVILDRFYDSTTAYQGYGRESVPLKEIQKLNQLASHNRKPDLTFYLKIPLDEARRRSARQHKDRMEQAGDLFYEKVIKGFEVLVTTQKRFVMIDATQSADRVHDQVWEHVQPQLSGR